MKLLKISLACFVVATMMFSCKPIYKCGEQKPAKKLFIPKAFQVVIDERDSLCTTLADRENRIAELNVEVSGLNKNIVDGNLKFNQLEQQYNDLMNTNLSQSEQYNLVLKQKSDELSSKEKLLFDRESALHELQKVIAHQDSVTKRLNSTLRDALLGFKSDELSVEIKNGKVYVSMSDKLLFKSGSAAVETKGMEAIRVLADVLNKNADIDILVEGHTDNIPIKTALYRDNWDLSVARSISIVHILTDEYKVPPTRLTASGKGEFSPRATNTTSEGRAQNRRTEIILSPKLDEIMQLLKAN
ncbi:MAG: OmpA family protein [Bacteroidales bacterium]|nr:OmpA family protein [Bacteroidales bacterium]